MGPKSVIGNGRAVPLAWPVSARQRQGTG